MTDRQAMTAAKRTLATAHETGADLAVPFASALPVDGAALSVLVGAQGQSTINASDRVAARLDELQFDLGEGPCWSAMTKSVPVLVDDLRESVQWPAFTEAVTADAVTGAVRSLFAFPLAIGSLDIGAVDLYRSTPGGLDHAAATNAATLTSLAAWQVLRRILDQNRDAFDDDARYSRREVHQATGMIIVQLGVGPADAELLLRAHAFSSGRSVRETANDVVERRLDFSGTTKDAE